MIKFEGTNEEFASLIRHMSVSQVELAYDRGKRDADRDLATRLAVTPGQAKLNALEDLIKAVDGKMKINAIKAVRELTGLGLKEAKNFVETHARFNPEGC